MMLNKNTTSFLPPAGYRLLIILVVLAFGLALMLPAVAFAEEVWVNNGLAGNNVNSVHVSPNFAKDYTIFAGTEGNGVYRSIDGGKNWTQVINGLTNLYVRAVSVSPDYATDHTVFIATAGGVFKTIDGNNPLGCTWTLASKNLTVLDVRAISVSPNYISDKTVFAGTHGGGIFKSTTAGSDWAQANSGLSNLDVRSIAVCPNYADHPSVIIGTFGGGVFRSTDAGVNWNAINNGITDKFITDIVLSPSFLTDHIAFIGANSKGIFKSAQLDQNDPQWTQSNTGISTTDYQILSIAISPDFAKDQTLFTGTNGGVYKSRDAGATWKQVNNGLMHKLIPSIDPSPCYCLDKTVYAGSDGGGVYSCVFSSAPNTTIEATPPSPNGTNGWYTATPSITLTMDRVGSATYYQWDSTSTAGWTTYSIGGLQAKEGQHTLYAFSTDINGNTGPVNSVAFKVDVTPPHDPSVSSPSHTLGGWSNVNVVTVNFSGASDDTSGVEGYSVEWSQSTSTVPDEVLDIPATTNSVNSSALKDGTWYFHLKTKDIAGNWTNAVHLGPFTIDTVASQTNISTSLAPNGTNGWYKTIPTITLTRSEAGTTYYQWDATTTAWTSFTTTSADVTGVKEGVHTLYYYSKDTAGNPDTLKSRVFMIDTSAPPVSTLDKPVSGASINNDTAPTFSWVKSSDANLAKYQLYVVGTSGTVTVDNIPPTVTSATLSSPLSPGNYTWHVVAVDSAGNTSQSPSNTITVKDVVAPTTTLSTNPSYIDGGYNWFKTRPAITLTANEPGTTFYQWDNTATAGWITYNSGSPIIPTDQQEGQHRLYYYSKDTAPSPGPNVETTKWQDFKIDTKAPGPFDLSSPANGDTTHDNTNLLMFSWGSSTDVGGSNGSGIDRYQLYIDGALKKDGIAGIQYTLTSALNAGPHTWYVKAVDAAGNATKSNSPIGQDGFTITIGDKVAPVTTVSSNPSYTAGWFNTIPTITLSRDEKGTTYYKWDNATGWATYNDTINKVDTTGLADGKHTLHFYSIDVASPVNTEAEKTLDFQIDTTQPNQFDIDPATDATTTNTSIPTFRWYETTDPNPGTGSGLAKYQLFFDGNLKVDNIPLGNSYTPSAPLADGTYSWRIKAVDNAGNVRESTSVRTLTVGDKLPPVTILEAPAIDGTNGWYKTTPTIKLTRNEPGVTYYKWETDQSWSTYSAGLSVSLTPPLEGEHIIQYYSVDNAGNIEGSSFKTFKVDTQKPTSFALYQPSNNATETNSDGQTFSWYQSSDDRPGMYYQLYIGNNSLVADHIASTSYKLPSSLAPGNYSWYVQAVDYAGNVTRTQSSSFNVEILDVVPPSTTLSKGPSYPDGTNNWYKNMPSLTLSRNEAGKTYYRWDSATNWMSFTADSISLSAWEGQHTLHYYSEDTALNKEQPVKDEPLNIDITKPTDFDISFPLNDAITTNTDNTMFKWGTSTDALSQLSRYQLYIDGVLKADNISTTSYTLPTPLDASSKPHTWYVKAVDNAGNEKQSTSTFNLNVTDVVKPVTTLTMPAISGDNGWYKGTVPTVSLSRNETGKTYYRWDSDISWTSFTAQSGTVTMPANPQGTHTLHYYSEDAWSTPNVETEKSQLFNIDTVAPSDFNITSPSNDATTTNLDTPTFNWNSSSDTNQPVHYQLYIDDKLADQSGAGNITGTTYTIKSPLSASAIAHTWYVVAVDNAGNTKKSTSTNNIKVYDKVPPQTTLSTNPAAANGTSGWFKTRPSIMLSRDEAGTTFYRWDDSGNWTSYTATSGGIASQEGIHKLSFYSVDTNGNVEGTHNMTISVDSSAPIATVSQPANNSRISGTGGNAYTIKGSASDVGASGVSGVEVSINNGTWKPASGTTSWSYDWSVPTNADGYYTIKVRAVDGAGNVQTPEISLTVMVDNTKPNVKSVSPADGAKDVSIAPTVSATFSEDMSSTTVTNNFTLKDGANNPVPGNVSYDAGTRVATFKPSVNLSYDTTHTATISTGVNDLAGSSMQANKVWSFRTKSVISSPNTLLSTDPMQPNGADGWFKTQPSIKLFRDKPGTTYYKWDDASWTTSATDTSSVPALEGQHTLAYYSQVDANTIEATNYQAFKIDWHQPTTPQNVKAIGTSSNNIQVTWDASTDNVGVTGYKVERDKGSTGTFTEVASVGKDTNLFTDSLEASTTCSYRVYALDAAGNKSDVSTVSTATTWPPPQQTGTGTLVPVTVGDVSLTFTQVTKPGQTSVTVSTSTPYDQALDPNYRFRGYYLDISTTADYSGLITVVVKYDPSLIKGGDKNLKLMHWNGQNWEVVSTKDSVDYVNHTITGYQYSLSPELVVPGPDNSQQIASLTGYGMNTDQLLVLALGMLMVGSILILRFRLS